MSGSCPKSDSVHGGSQGHTCQKLELLFPIHLSGHRFPVDTLDAMVAVAQKQCTYSRGRAVWLAIRTITAIVPDVVSCNDPDRGFPSLEQKGHGGEKQEARSVRLQRDGDEKSVRLF